jgi:hypothetical protein
MRFTLFQINTATVAVSPQRNCGDSSTFTGFWPVLVAATLIGATAALPTVAAEKSTAQYRAEAEALEAQADRLLQNAPAARPLALPAAATPGKRTPKTPSASGAVKIGVYGCMNQDAYEIPTLQWGILDASNYSDFDGGRGRYVYDDTSHVLTFTSGKFKGLRRLRTDERAFRILDENGAMTAFNCPWTPKDPRKVRW